MKAIIYQDSSCLNYELTSLDLLFHLPFSFQEKFLKTNDISKIVEYKEGNKGVTDFIISFLKFKDGYYQILDPHLKDE